MAINPLVENYLRDGCGRCDLFRTPQCKVHRWTEELAMLRRILLDGPLAEDLKWSHPVYTLGGKNVAMLGAFNDHCTLSFFKGALMRDPHGILELPGENTQAARIVKITSIEQIGRLEPALREYIEEAAGIERSGAKVKLKTIDEHPVPEELLAKFEESPEFRAAFESLTPGRRRGYLIHFSGAKQSKTRLERIEKCTPLIMIGKGLHDR